MANWTRDRNRQLRKRAIREECEAQQTEWAARARHKVRPRRSKAEARAIAEEMMLQFQERNRTDQV